MYVDHVTLHHVFTTCNHTSHFMSCDTHVDTHMRFSRRDQSQRRGREGGAHDPFITKGTQKRNLVAEAAR